MSFGEGSLHDRIAHLETENGALKLENKRLEKRIEQLSLLLFLAQDGLDGAANTMEAAESLVRDMWLQLLNAYDAKELDGFAERMAELGLEVDG